MDFHKLTSTFFVLSGPCAVESRELCLRVADEMKNITHDLGIDYVFKASYRKANRSSLDSFTGIGDEKALRILEDVKNAFDLPIVTDIHTAPEAAWAAEVVDVLQIPAFLCRQTDLILAAAQTGKVVNIKKGQFLAPAAMKFPADKVLSTGNDQVLLTERGTTFGYGDLVVDVRGIPTMKALGHPVVMDVTHALQRPNQSSGVTGGSPEYIATMAYATIAAGASGLFLETHPDPSQALSDGANMLPLDKARSLLTKAKTIYDAVN